MHNTKKVLTEALKKLMETKPLNKISIKEITDEAGMNRQSFYYHFNDIYDQIRWMYEEEAIILLKEHDGALFWQDGLLQLMKYIEGTKKIHLCVLNSMGRDMFRHFYKSDIRFIIKELVTTYDCYHGRIDHYGDFLTHFYTVSLGAMLESWLMAEIALEPEEMVKLIDITIQDQINGALMRQKAGRCAPPQE